jgi:hypothetical protein
MHDKVVAKMLRASVKTGEKTLRGNVSRDRMDREMFAGNASRDRVDKAMFAVNVSRDRVGRAMFKVNANNDNKTGKTEVTRVVDREEGIAGSQLVFENHLLVFE